MSSFIKIAICILLSSVIVGLGCYHFNIHHDSKVDKNVVIAGEHVSQEMNKAEITYRESKVVENNADNDIAFLQKSMNKLDERKYSVLYETRKY